MLALLFAAALAAPVVHVIPQPKVVEESSGPLVLRGEFAVWVVGNDRDVQFAARQLAAGLSGQAQVRQGVPREPFRGVALIQAGVSERGDELASGRGLRLTGEMAEEGYAVSVEPSGAVAYARTPAGLFYAVQTLLQMARKGGEIVRLPAVRIHDWPTMRLRGIMNDQSRGQVPTPEMARRIVDFCAKYKLNFYSPYIEHTFAWRGHEDIWRGSGAWTAEEFMELCKYARMRHVMVIPQFEAFGHQSHILTKPRYKHMAETTGWSFAPAVEDTYKLLDDLIGQMIAAFPFHSYFGIGCDEVWDMGRGKSKELMKKLGGRAQLFAYHIKRVNEIVRKYGRRAMMWGDMPLRHREALGLLPKDIIILDWHYGAAARYPSVKVFRDAGFDVVVCPALSSWVRIFPDYINAFANIQNLIAEGQRWGALGAMTCNWGDWGAENFVDYNWLGWAWAAECSWGRAEKADRRRVMVDFCQTFFGTRTDRLAQAMWALAQANRAYPWAGSVLGHFHMDPFSQRAAKSWPSRRAAQKLRELVTSAIEQIQTDLPRVQRNKRCLDYILHAARRYLYVADRCGGIHEACELYEAAWQSRELLKRRELAGQALAKLQELRRELADVREEFRRLWLASYRPEGLEFDLKKFDRQLAAYDQRIAALKKALATGQFPEPAKIGLASRIAKAGIPVKALAEARREKWWDERWPMRAAIRLEAGDLPRGRAPVTLRLDLSRLAGAEISPDSVRVVIGGRAWPAQVAPLWTSEGLRAGAAVCFVMPAALDKGGALDGWLYFAPAGTSLPRPSTDLKVEQTSEGVWVENSRLRILVGSEGGHVYVWQVKALGGLDITQPGRKDWFGFLDVRSVRNTPMELKVIQKGPVVAIVRAAAPNGLVKHIFVYAGLPIVEMRLSQATDWMWNYDNVRNFAADAPKPGRARFEDGTDKPVPRSNEQVHVVPGKHVRWGCKYRDDGLTLGLITPDCATRLIAGPGGGWGGIGIERSPSTTSFVVYCDVVEAKWRAVAELCNSLRTDRPMLAFVGPVARR